MATERVRVPAADSDWPAADPGLPGADVEWPTAAPDWAATSADRTTSLQDLATLVAPEPARAPIDADLIDVASGMAPGKALDLGCGSGQNSVWLARRGWTVTGVDISTSAIEEARSAAAAAGHRIVFDSADISAWRPASRFDLVVSTFALPARGMGRSRMLEMAAAAVAPGGTLLLTELDVSLAQDGWMAQKHLVSIEEIERHLGGFRVDRSGVQVRRRRHGYDELVLPVAIVIATRRTDLRHSY